MTVGGHRRTLRQMDRWRPRAACIVSALVCTALAWGIDATAARAADTTVEGVAAPIVRVNVRQGNVVIRTWNRESVLVNADPAVSVERRSADPDADDASLLIPEIEGNGPHGTVSLPAETFVISPIAPGERELVLVRSLSPTDVGTVTVTVPADAAFVFARAAHGYVRASHYRAGTFVAFAAHGRIALEDIGGTAFVQTARGPIVVSDSHLDRVRARSLFGNVTFERCDVRQIETTTIEGSIVYDAGTFAPGLARFESTTGNVAIGVSDGARLGGHTAETGHVFTDFGPGAHVDASDRDAQAVVSGGGPLVTATSSSGNVYLYDGSLRAKDRPSPAWRAPTATLRRAPDPRERPSDLRERAPADPARPPAFARPLQALPRSRPR